MPDYAVQSGVDNFLILLHFDSPGQIGVLPQDLGVEQVADQKQGGRRPYGPGRQHAPSETPVEACGHEGSDKEKAAELDHGLLFSLFFLCIQPFLEQLRIFRQHDQAGAEHRHEKDAHQQPSLPVMERSRRHKKQKSDNCGSKQ